MENFNAIVDDILTFEITSITFKNKEFFVLRPIFYYSDKFWSVEFKRTKSKAITELISMPKQAAARQLQRLYRVIECMNEIVKNDKRLYENPNDVMLAIHDFTHLWGLHLDLNTELLNRAFVTNYFLLDLTRELFYKKLVIDSINDGVNFSTIAPPVIYEPRMDGEPFPETLFVYNFDEYFYGQDEYEKSYLEWEQITGYAKIKNKLTIPQVAIRHHYLVKAGVEPFIIPKHVGEKYKSLGSSKNIEIAYGKINNNKVDLDPKDLYPVLETLKEYPKAVELIKQDIDRIS